MDKLRLWRIVVDDFEDETMAIGCCLTNLYLFRDGDSIVTVQVAGHVNESSYVSFPDSYASKKVDFKEKLLKIEEEYGLKYVGKDVIDNVIPQNIYRLTGDKKKDQQIVKLLKDIL
ncbi:MAG: hypothetical protein ACOX71_03200 [Lachnospiraceae bacterium]|jgi:hypothetical protein